MPEEMYSPPFKGAKSMRIVDWWHGLEKSSPYNVNSIVVEFRLAALPIY